MSLRRYSDGYAAPEQLPEELGRLDAPVSAASDMWAVGVLTLLAHTYQERREQGFYAELREVSCLWLACVGLNQLASPEVHLAGLPLLRPDVCEGMPAA